MWTQCTVAAQSVGVYRPFWGMLTITMVLTYFQFHIFNFHSFWKSKKAHIFINNVMVSVLILSHDWIASCYRLEIVWQQTFYSILFYSSWNRIQHLLLCSSLASTLLSKVNRTGEELKACEHEQVMSVALSYGVQLQLRKRPLRGLWRPQGWEVCLFEFSRGLCRWAESRKTVLTMGKSYSCRILKGFSFFNERSFHK